jgi:3-deoxy-D-manno-octulosonate 8-phosphate phosphatase (KDO 8-P phosphatase)
MNSSNAIKLVILDVDGVLTDGGMYYTENGDQFKKFNTKDGLAIKRLAQNGIMFGIISNGSNTNLINLRAAHLGINHVYCGIDNKLTILKAWLQKLKIQPSEVAYIGDDVNDIECMQYVGFTACPNDAHFKIKAIANTILQLNGGQGCVREFLDFHFEV